MDAVVYLNSNGEHMVSLRVSGQEVDEAGPFEDRADALLAAERAVYDDGMVVES